MRYFFIDDGCVRRSLFVSTLHERVIISNDDKWPENEILHPFKQARVLIKPRGFALLSLSGDQKEIIKFYLFLSCRTLRESKEFAFYSSKER